MSLELSSRRKLAQFMTDHILLDVDRNKLFSVVHSDGVANHFRDDCRPSRPRLMDAFLIGLVHPRYRPDQVVIKERPFSNRSCHNFKFGFWFVVSSFWSRALSYWSQTSFDSQTRNQKLGTRNHKPETYFFPLRTMNLSVRLLFRVLYPRVGCPHGVTGFRPPDVLPSPPPCG